MTHTKLTTSKKKKSFITLLLVLVSSLFLFHKNKNKSSYKWTAKDIDWSNVDAIEIWGVSDNGDACEPCTSISDTPDFYSVYKHISGKGVMCIADRDTKVEAQALATKWGNRYVITINDFSTPA